MEKQLKKHQKKNSLPSFRLPALTRLVTPARGRFSAPTSGALLEHVARRVPRGPARAPSPSSGFLPSPLGRDSPFRPNPWVVCCCRFESPGLEKHPGVGPAVLRAT